MTERPVNLVVEIHSVGDQNDLVIWQVLADNGLGQHDHRQRLAATLRMPDDASFAPAFIVSLANSLEDLFNAKELLIPGYLFLASVEDREVEASNRGSARDGTAKTRRDPVA